MSKWEDVSDEQLGKLSYVCLLVSVSSFYILHVPTTATSSEKLDGVSRKWKRKRKFVDEDVGECNTQDSPQIEVPTSDPSGTSKKRVCYTSCGKGYMYSSVHTYVAAHNIRIMYL